MTLDSLLNLAGVTKYQRALWFRSAQLSGDTLILSDIDDYGGVSRQFGNRLREVLPSLQITFAPPVFDSLHFPERE